MINNLLLKHHPFLPPFTKPRPVATRPSGSPSPLRPGVVSRAPLRCRGAPVSGPAGGSLGIRKWDLKMS